MVPECRFGWLAAGGKHESLHQHAKVVSGYDFAARELWLVVDAYGWLLPAPILPGQIASRDIKSERAEFAGRRSGTCATRGGVAADRRQHCIRSVIR
jgi:hypothetical protein